MTSFIEVFASIIGNAILGILPVTESELAVSHKRSEEPSWRGQ